MKTLDQLTYKPENRIYLSFSIHYDICNSILVQPDLNGIAGVLCSYNFVWALAAALASQPALMAVNTHPDEWSVLAAELMLSGLQSLLLSELSEEVSKE